MHNEENNFLANEDANLSLGQRLVKGREAMGLSQEEVARRLFLSKKIVSALENDDYTQIAAATYARGYLRAYAQLLGIAEEELLKDFAEMPLPKAAHKNTLEDHYQEQKIALDQKKNRWVSYVLVLILIVLVVIWAMRRHSDTNNKTTPSALGENVTITNTGNDNTQSNTGAIDQHKNKKAKSKDKAIDTKDKQTLTKDTTDDDAMAKKQLELIKNKSGTGHVKRS